VPRTAARRWLLAALALLVVLVPGCSVPVAHASQGAHLSGAFLGSDAAGVAALPGFGAWRGTGDPLVGHTYLPGGSWADVEGPAWLVGPWARWRTANPARLLVLNVPMLVPNEAGLPDAAVRALLQQGAAGRFDAHFAALARRLVAAGAPDAVLVLGWEMNGTTYTGRCGPDPADWQAYWRRIVDAMRAVPGSRFRFDFAPSRGTDAVPWTRCYPGDDDVDVIGMDSYDQPPGRSFADYVWQPLGLAEQARFASAHGKPMSFPEWGLFRYGDDPDFVAGMSAWVRSHDVLYETITDYCPHGVWRCAGNPRSAATYRELFGTGH
jgi:hypothetical protein